MERESLGGKGTTVVFPREGRIKAPIRDAIERNVFNSASIELDHETVRKRFLLRVQSSRVPFMTWSTG
ncbi:MAG: hypothetical protein NZM43_04665 [Saprospiraceae bacterium]|nr:hypothetical protein [Saprospiraceae bacterium]MDW8483601.1 hypothetical protein [Saprospiraceae bacterium]